MVDRINSLVAQNTHLKELLQSSVERLPLGMLGGHYLTSVKAAVDREIELRKRLGTYDPDETNRQRLDKIGERDLVFRPSTTPAPHPQ